MRDFAVVRFRQRQFCRLELLGCRSTQLEHLQLERDALPGERVIGVEPRDPVLELHHAQEYRLSVLAIRLEFVARARSRRQLARLDADQRGFVALPKGLRGRQLYASTLPHAQPIDGSLDRERSLTYPKDELHGFLRAWRLHELVFLIEKPILEANDHLRADGLGH